MSGPAVSRTCLRCLRSFKTLDSSPRALSATRATPQRSFHAPAPLYLDFLAPSWRTTSRQAPFKRSGNSLSPSRALQRRSISATSRRNAVAIKNPRKDDEGNDMVINITPRAAHRLQNIASTDNNPNLALRVAVESGGCHGFQYLMSLTNLEEVDPEEDSVFEHEEVVSGGDGGYKAKVVMDEPSLELLKGSSIDYTMELIGSQFKVTGIPGAKSSCGCGTSFDIAA